MNNPLAQKYNYYLNESHRLSEELKNEVEYIQFLENIISQTTSLEELEEQLRSSVNSRTGAYTRGFVRRIGNAIGLAAPISKKHKMQQSKIHREIEDENSASEIEHGQREQQAKNTNYDANSKHAEAMKKWETQKAVHGNVQPDINVDERSIRKNHRAGQAGFEYKGASGKLRQGGQWHGADDEIALQYGKQAARNRANASAQDWLRDNPKPVAPKLTSAPEAKAKRIAMFGDNKPKN